MTVSVQRRVFGPVQAYFARLGECDLRSLSLFRILLALTALVELYGLAGHLEDFYSDLGVLPRSTFLEYSPGKEGISIHLASGSLWFQAALLTITMLAALALLVGWRSQPAAFVLWFLLLSLHHRNELIDYGGDVLLRTLTMFAILLPVGARFSIDAAHRRMACHEGEQRHRSLVFFALVVQVACVYVFSGTLKVYDPMWAEGTGLFYALHWEQYVRFAGWLVRELPLPVLEIMNFAVIFIETALPFLLFIPFSVPVLRGLAIVSFWLLHIGIYLTLDVGLFSIVGMVAWIPLLPSAFWSFAVAKYFPLLGTGGMPAQTIEPRPSDRPVPKPGWGMLRSVMVTAVMLHVVSWNLSTIHPSLGNILLPSPLRSLGFALGLDQRWGLFTPTMQYSDWISVGAARTDGSLDDILQGLAPYSFTPPENIRRTFRSPRWRKFWTNTLRTSPGHRAYLSNYGRLVCRRSAVHDPPNRRIEALEVITVRRQITVGVQTAEPLKYLLWKHECFKGALQKWENALPFERLPYTQGLDAK